MSSSYVVAFVPTDSKVKYIRTNERIVETYVVQEPIVQMVDPVTGNAVSVSTEGTQQEILDLLFRAVNYLVAIANPPWRTGNTLACTAAVSGSLTTVATVTTVTNMNNMNGFTADMLIRAQAMSAWSSCVRQRII